MQHSEITADTGPSDGLFGPLRRPHFQLFSGSGAHFFAQLVCHLETRLFDLAVEPVTRKDFHREIEAFLDQKAWREARERGELEFEGGNTPPYQVARRLQECGWIVEQREGYKRYVDLDANARLLLQSLLDIATGRVRSFGQEVLKVSTLLRTAVERPDQEGLNLRSAATASRQFLVNLKAIATAIRGAEEDMVRAGTAEGVIDGYFGDYITDTLVADYRHLRSGNNPFRFRSDILSVVQTTLADEDLIEDLARTYQKEHLAPNRAAARELIEDDLELITRIFDAVDLHIDRLEKLNHRIERRVRNTLHFLDRVEADDTRSYLDALAKMKEVASVTDGFPAPGALIEDSVPIDVRSLRRGRIQPVPPVASRVRRAPPDPAAIAFEHARRDYQLRGLARLEAITDYLDRAMGPEMVCRAAELPIETLDDFFAFERLRTLSPTDAARLEKHFTVTIEGGRICNDWIECDAFTVRRTHLPLPTETPE